MTISNLRPASWRGVPFALTASAQRVGRRKAQHDYPFRDTVWLEDTGKLPPAFKIQGFLVSDSQVYGGGDVQGQIARMQVAAEAAGQGLLVHPTRGPLLLDLLDLVINERWDEQGSCELEFSFVQGGAQGFPAVLSAVSNILGAAAGFANSAGLSDFASALSGAAGGFDQAAGLAASAQAWAFKAIAFAGDATALCNTVSQLGGANYGRYAAAGNAGFLQDLKSPYAGAASVQDLIAKGAANRAAVSAAADTLTATVADYGAGKSASDVGAAAQAVVVALGAAAASPTDGIRIMAALAAYTPGASVQLNPAAAALTTLFQRAAVAGAAQAAGQYAPSSSDDANAVRAQVSGLITAQILAAGASGEDASFAAMRALRQALFQDLGQRGASLPSLVEVVSAQPLPAVVIAQRHYGDPRRRDELVTQANPIHPLFMPTSFKALAR